MKLRVVALAAVAIALSAGAVMADSWTGFYAGLSVGTASAKDTWSAVGTSFSGSGHSAIGGVQAGYTWQNGSILAGIEGDYMFSGHRVTESCPNPAYNCEAKVNGLGSLRGRLGWVAAPSAMVYFTGGLGWAGVDRKAYNVATGSLVGGGSASHTSTGLVLGGGAEFLVAKNWTVKGEYLHYNFGSYTASVAEFPTNQPTFKMNADTFKIGVNYKF